MSGVSSELVCRTNGRRAKVRAARLGGVDAVEVGDDGLTLTVTFIGKAPHGLCPENVRIDGGRRSPGPRPSGSAPGDARGSAATGIEAVEVCVEREEDPELDDRLLVTLDRTGDLGPYRLSIVATDPYGRPGTEPFHGFDQRYYYAEFRFGSDCPTPFDCADEQPDCPPTFRPAPVIDYTARDYDTLRQLVLDRMALTTPDWTERHAPDLGVTLAEILAYTADRISYQQDAVATEAYLDTARRRVSVRRHVRLIDYPMHDGCNARAFVALEAVEPLTLLPGAYRFAAVDVRTLGPHDAPEPGTVIDDGDLSVLDERGSVEVFEPVAQEPLRLLPAHNAIRFWTWGDEVCSLPKGATSATLRDTWADRAEDVPGAPAGTPQGTGEPCRERQLDLRPGDLLLFEEVLGPRSGTPGDADPAHRQAVRLTSVTPAVDRLSGRPVLEVTWSREDALAFPVCLSTLGGTDCAPVEDVSVARGNVALVDHGRSTAFCGALPERITVPADPPVPAPCGPDASGCPDRARGNAPAELIDSLLEKTRCGRLLRPDDIRELFSVVGEEATRRAGLALELAGRRPGRGTEDGRVVPGTAYAQASALQTLLAQGIRPGIAPRFRPVLHGSPVVQAVPFPEPRHLSAGQADRLAAVPERVRERLVELWRSARDHDGLAGEEIAELTVLFGLKVLERFELRRHPVRALRELLHRSERLLSPKRRRLTVLAARARAGAVLDGRTAWEIAHTWGPAYAEGLHPQETVLHGPAAALVQDPRAALPAVRLADGDAVWEPRRDLLDSGARDRHFTGELEDDGRLALRFGDNRYGARPRSGATLEVRYRLGGGPAGNVGAEAINHLVLCRDEEAVDGGDPMPVAGVRNPLPAVGGTAPEPVEQVRQLAPLEPARTRLRAVTAEDYAVLAAALPGVQRAAAEIRWTGSVQEAHVAIDAYGTGDPPPDLLDAVAYALEGYRRIGHDLVVGPARTVPLDIALEVCAEPGHQQGQIMAELYRVLGSRALPAGRLGFFHPDALTFGEPVRLSRLVAVAAAVQGVRSVHVTRLRRLFQDDHGEMEAGVLRLGPLEIARCDNDPRQPGNGRLRLTFGGVR
ncbi:putative baseplate assembly protein [Streptomyces sp. NPDC048639]|uniref:putative baseplate assembly protein n=1 Tax=Streptomyces sp. NPDC048639 TaxID=3365581 RepID=UPI00371FB99D